MVGGTFEWEKPLVELEKRIIDLQNFTQKEGIDLSKDIATLEEAAARLRMEIYAGLTPWQRVQIARHKDRPTTLDYISLIFEDFVELHGDRAVREDQALIGGIAMLDGTPVTVIGPQKGRDTKENIRRNFGLPHPEGYRKAMRLAAQAEKFNRPVISLIDVVGAYPGIEAEERGQGVLIAESIQFMSMLKVPTICIITGEGGSGGALAIGVGDRMLMLENAWYSVISPEMCAQILWRDTNRAAEAADTLHLTAMDLKKFEIVDEIIPEPLGGAQRDSKMVADALKEAIKRHLMELRQMDPETMLRKRHERYRRIGVFNIIEEAEEAKDEQ
jgi:acetyl-CoA carboxylase carboxyl transferase subunit alpha